METPANAKIMFVDDEAPVRAAVKAILKRQGYAVQVFPGGIECLTALRGQDCDLLITDVNMPDMNGLELVQLSRRIWPHLSILVVTGYGSIAMAVQAVKAGAVDFIEKPLSRENLLFAIQQIIGDRTRKETALCKRLTQSERRVLRLILSGKSNKEAAHVLCRSIRTVEDHRNHIMNKLRVNNVVELVKVAVKSGMVQP